MLAEDRASSGALRPIVAGLGAAVLFEALTVLETQDKTIRAASPWQDDPYDAVVSLAQLTVPVLALAIGLRLLAWRWPGGADRSHQMVRAVATIIGLTGLTVVFEWAAVAAGIHRSSWDGWTGLLIAGLVADSVLLVAAVTLMARCRCPRSAAAGWRHDWLGDVALACERLPVARLRVTQQSLAWVRRHAMSVFVAASVLAAGTVAGAQARGERWTNPLLIGWAVVVETSAFIAFLLSSNAIAGFIARPPRSRTRRTAEAAAVSGGAAVQVAVAFRTTLWQLIHGGALTSAAELAALTLGAGAVTFLATAAGLLWLRPPRISGGQHRSSVGRGQAPDRPV